MRQIILEAPETLRDMEVPLPEVEPGWILAKTIYTGICGTDVHSYLGETIFGKVFPFHIGHEVCAEVVETGAGSRTLKPGDAIVVNPFFTCHSCRACYSGMENNCEHKTTIGLKGPGGFSEYIYVPESSAFRIQSNDYISMCLTEPLATVIYGYDKLRIDSSKRVLIRGVGSIGLMFVQLFHAANVARLAAIDFNMDKLSAAKALGADEALNLSDHKEKQRLEELGREGFDIVVDCTGSIQSMQTTVEQIAFGGQILLFGLCTAEAAMEIKPFRLYQKDACIMTSFALDQRSFRKAVALLENGKIKMEPLIDSVQPLTELENSIKRIADGKTVGKIVIDTRAAG